jgi:hypothetical protein
MRLLLHAVLALACAHAFAQGSPEPLPGELLAGDRKDLETRRDSLLAQRQSLGAGIQAHNARCGKVAEDSPLVAECRASQAALGAQIKRYQEALAEYRRLLAEKTAAAKERRAQCAAALRQAEMDRRQIERQRQNIEMSQQELAEWSRLNEEAQKKALVAAVKFTVGTYTADIQSARASVSKLERHAAYLAKKAAQSRKYSTRMKYAAQLDSTLDRLDPKWAELMEKELLKAALDAEKAWSVARNTMHHEFRVAARHNESIRELLSDPAFRDAFSGDDIDTPGLDTFSTLAQSASEEIARFAVGLERYGKFTGPAVRAAVFVRDAAYSALLSWESTERVVQQSDEVAGDLARATASLQAQYKKSVDAVRGCRRAGIAP